MCPDMKRNIFLLLSQDYCLKGVYMLHTVSHGGFCLDAFTSLCMLDLCNQAAVSQQGEET